MAGADEEVPAAEEDEVAAATTPEPEKGASNSKLNSEPIPKPAAPW